MVNYFIESFYIDRKGEKRIRNIEIVRCRRSRKHISDSPLVGKEENIKAENSAMKNKTKANDPYEMNLILKRIELLEQKVKDLENKGLSENKNFINSYENTTTKIFK